MDWSSSPSVSLGKSKRRERSKSPAPKKRSRTNEDPDDGVVSIPDSDSTGGVRRAVALKSTLDPDSVIKTFRLKGSKLVYFWPHDLPFNLGIVSGRSKTTNSFTLPWVICSQARSKAIAKLFLVWLSVDSFHCISSEFLICVRGLIPFASHRRMYHESVYHHVEATTL